jgi:carbamoyl-phosphate synthase large subunit
MMPTICSIGSSRRWEGLPMPRRDDLHTILVIGSGPIVIGQACEFDYSGTQAIRALRADGYRVVLINSNPATIMTDPEFADATYLEPLTPESVEEVIRLERPDALLPTLGGQTALNLTFALDRMGVLERYGVELIGASIDAIEAAEQRQRFKTVMHAAGLATPESAYCRSVDEALDAAGTIGYPVIVRPSYIMGGGGTGMADGPEELRRVAGYGITASPIREILVEQSVLGWKEFELEVMRDRNDNAVVVCSIENFDPMGVHTGDSITVAPAQTLSDREYQAMRDDALTCLRAVGVETGGSNVQFAVDPATGRRLVIEMNPRVSRSSALASKATGFPIAKIAARLAVGYTLDEIANDITGATPASFEPALDYVVVKIPRFDFAKFPDTPVRLGTAMQSVGEAMAIGRTFPEALQKALRSLETGRAGLAADGAERELMALPDADLWDRVRVATPDRIFGVAELLRRGADIDGVAAATNIDPWFVDQMAEVVEARLALEETGVDPAALWSAKRLGFSDRQIGYLWKTMPEAVREMRRQAGIQRTYKTVDTCAGEFEATTPYFYGTFEDENEAAPSTRPTVMVLGSGPNRIGQGIEFDYCCVHAAFALRDAGYRTVMVNCNPETVSTDYDTSDRLYFEPLTAEDVLAVAELERPDAIIVQLGGQTPLGLGRVLEEAGFTIAGTSPDAIDAAEDRERFSALCASLGITQPPHGTATTVEDASQVADSIGFPVLVRPSYVLGGRAMRIVYGQDELSAHLSDLFGAVPDSEVDLSGAPVLIDRYLEQAVEVDVDAVFDGSELLVGGVMEHIEQAGVHSGDSACVIPPRSLSEASVATILEHTRALAEGLGVRGLINIQFAVRKEEVFVLEVNPRGSRTVPFVSKATGIPLAGIATRVMMGERLEDLRRAGSIPAGEVNIPFVAVKEAVMPWNRFPREDVNLGPEMRATGEVMGIGTTFGSAYGRAQLGAGHTIPRGGTVFFSVADPDKESGLAVAAGFHRLGFRILATAGTARFLTEHGIPAVHVDKVGDGEWDPVRLIEGKKIDLVVNTPHGRRARGDGRLIRSAAHRVGIPCVTTVPGAAAVVESLTTGDPAAGIRPLQAWHGCSVLPERGSTDEVVTLTA